MGSEIEVFLADSKVIFREGMHFILESEGDIRVIGEASSADEVLASLRKQVPDVLVLSEDMRNLTDQVRAAWPNTGLVLVSECSPSAQRVGAWVACSLSRDMNPEELVKAVRKVGQGDSSVPISVDAKGAAEAVRSLKEHLLSLVDSL